MRITSVDQDLDDGVILQILRESEGRRVGSRPPGHTIARHDLFDPFKHRTNIYLKDLRGRFLQEGEERTSMSGAFQNGLVPALVFTFRQAAGKAAIADFLQAGHTGVTLKADIRAGSFRIVYYRRRDGAPNASGTGFAPLSEDTDFWIPRTGTAQGIFVMLLKTDDGQAHIQTAYPIAEFPGLSEVRPIPRRP